MRTSTLITGAALVAGAFASPLFKRDLEVDTVYDVTYETVYVTETEGVTAAAVATSTSTLVAAVPATTSSIVTVQHYGHRHSWSKAASSSVAPVASSSVVTSAAPVATSSVEAKAALVVSTSSTEAAAAGYTSAWTSTWASTWVVTPSAESTTAVVSSAAATSAASTEASKTSTAATGKATTYQEKVLAHHNIHRANHSASDLVWDTDLANTAATIAATCVYAHSMDVNGGGYGQNIAAGVEATNISAVITELFYNGEVNYFTDLYGEANPDMTNFENWGHFSQLVWKSTTKVGCATQYCSGGLTNVGSGVSPYFTVCNYGTPGNYAGEYAENIGDSLNNPTQDWSYDL